MYCSQNILNETLKRLTSAIENPSEYKLLLQGLIAQVLFLYKLKVLLNSTKLIGTNFPQGLFQLLVAKVEIKCRERDLALIQVNFTF